MITSYSVRIPFLSATNTSFHVTCTVLGEIATALTSWGGPLGAVCEIKMIPPSLLPHAIELYQISYMLEKDLYMEFSLALGKLNSPSATVVNRRLNPRTVFSTTYTQAILYLQK